jgi:ribonuclease P protein component
MDEADLSTQRAQTRQNSRFPQADVDQGRPGRHPVAPGEGSQAPVGVTSGPIGRPRRPGVGPVRSRETFAELRRNSSRGRCGPVSVSFLDRPAWDRPQVAYAVNRNVGNAVQRNLLRRRMRAIVAGQSAGLPVGAYVVRSNPGGPALEFDELKVVMSQALEKATNRAPSRAAR